jgi:hypothetical protein
MVQYIPGPSGSFPYPNAGSGDLKYQMMGDFGGSLGNLLAGLAQAHQEQQQKLKQQALMKQFMDAMSPDAKVPGPQLPQPPNTQGKAGTQPGQNPMMSQRLSQIIPILLQMSQFNPGAKEMLAPAMRSMFPVQKTGGQPLIDTPFGQMSPYQWAGLQKRQQTIDLAHQRLSEERKRIENGIITNTEKETQMLTQPFDEAENAYMGIMKARSQLPADTTNKDLANAWEHYNPKTGVVKDPLFGSIHPELKNYVQTISRLQQTLGKFASNPKDPHAFTYQTMINLVPQQTLPTLKQLKSNLDEFHNNVLAIKRSTRLSAEMKYRNAGMTQYQQIQQQVMQDPGFSELPADTSSQDFSQVDSELGQ